MCKCARPGCLNAAKSSCSVCGREQYCSSSCQKLDWKVHKSLCPTLKKLSTKLQPFYVVEKIIYEVENIIDETLKSTKGTVRVLEHLLSFAEFQFGKAIPGQSYRERKNGERISNMDVEINLLLNINDELIKIHRHNDLFSANIRDDMTFPYQERSLAILNSWLIYLDSDASNGIDSLTETQKNGLLCDLSNAELGMAVVATNRRQHDIAEGHCQRCLAYSRRIGREGKEKTTMIFSALRTYCGLRESQDNLLGALSFAEDLYNLVVEAYDPVHCQVQEAAGVLIDILTRKGDLYNAERYAEVTYGNLRDKKNGINQEGEEVANGAYNLANIIAQNNGDLVKAERLAREVLRIRTLIYHNCHNRIGMSCSLLANILEAQNNLGDETKALFERSLNIFIKNEGSGGGYNTAVGNKKIAQYYFQLSRIQPTIESKRREIMLGKSHLEETIRIFSEILGPTHPDTTHSASELANINEVLLIVIPCHLQLSTPHADP